MTLPIIDGISKCLNKDIPKAVRFGLVGLDATATVTCLVLGILGATATVGWLTPAASYALIGVSGGIIALWIFGIAKEKCCSSRSSRYEIIE